MWIQLLTVVGVMLSIPLASFLTYRVVYFQPPDKTKPVLAGSKTENKEISKSPRSIASKADGHKGFSESLELLECRILENRDTNIYGYLVSLLEELESLDAKLQSVGINQQAKLTYAKYLPIIQKILEITAPNKYGDFIQNPDHWTDPKRMRIQVELSVLSVAKEVSGDIRKLNSSQELNFQVSVESLIGKAAAAPEKRDPDNVIEDLLNTESSLGEIQGNLSSLKHTLAKEAESIRFRAMAEAKAESLEAESAKKFQAGSQRSLNMKPDAKEPRPKVFSKEVFQQSWVIYGGNSSDSKFLVSYSDIITGTKYWEKFDSAFDAAQYVDKAILKESAKHNFKCKCVYCKEVTEVALPS